MNNNKAIKYPIIENKAIKGGLIGSIQRYSIYYLFPKFNEDGSLKYNPKISIEHYIEAKGVENQKPSSLRFDNAVLVTELIMELVRALALFEKKLHKDIKPLTELGEKFYKTRIMDLLEQVDKNYKEILLNKE